MNTCDKSVSLAYRVGMVMDLSRLPIREAIDSVVLLLHRLEEEADYYPSLAGLQVARDEVMAAIHHMRNAERHIETVTSPSAVKVPFTR